jgi:hypothetical protein
MANIDRDSQEFADDTIRRFLLGRLKTAEQSTFEEHLFTDDRLEARVRLAEFDLADEYALERLSVVDREAFDQNFLLSDRRRRTLNISIALRDRFVATSNVATVVTKISIGERLQRMFGFNQRAWRLGFAVVIALVLLGAAWLVLRRPRIAERIGETIFRRHAPVPAQSPNVPRPAAHANNTSLAPEHSSTPSPMPPHEPTASPAILSVALFRGTPRGQAELPRIDLPKGEHDIVRLQLPLKSHQTGVYRAELLTSENQSIFTGESLESTDADKGNIEFDVPARLLKPGDYQIRLGRPANETRRGETKYYFRVLP